MTHFNIYRNVTNPLVFSSVTINQWFNHIKSSDYSQTISQARLGQVDYDLTKSQLPAITYNFTYSNYKKDANVIDGTGLLYLDIDSGDFDISSIDANKVYSYYRSFGGVGYSIIIRVNNLTLNNFKPTYTAIIEDLGLTTYVDKNAIKASQFNVLSYDPNIFINESSFIYDSINENVSPSLSNNKKKEYTIEGDTFLKKIRYDNTNEIDKEGKEYIVNWNGYEVVKCFIPIQKIQDGNRYSFFLGYASNLLWLNQHLGYDVLLSILKNVNTFACLNPIDEQQLIKITKSVLAQLADDLLKPTYFNKKRKIVFDENSKLDREAKINICLKEFATKKRNDSQQKIYDIIENWSFENGKITIRKIVELNSISSKTVIKYWSNFKDYVKDLNTSNKAKLATSKPIKPIAKQTNKQTSLVAYNVANEAEQDTIDNKYLIYLSEGFLKIA